jgi:hypothetical protein
VGFILHPAGEDATFGANPFWAPAHGLLWIAFMIALPGWIGLYIVQAERAGKFGILGFCVIILGTAFASWIFSSDVTFVPVIAAKNPLLFKEIFNTGHILIGVSSVLAWVLGNILFGIAIVRAKIFSKWPGIMLAIGTVIFPIAYLSGLSIKVIVAGALIAGAGQIWLGYSLLQIIKTTKFSR